MVEVNGDINNPIIVGGTQKYTYKCGVI